MGRRNGLIEVGFWKEGTRELSADLPDRAALVLAIFRFANDLIGGYPDVRERVDPHWDPLERRFVIEYLKSAPRGEAYCGHSTCRFCGADNGSADMHDDVYIWPEGFAHYLEKHQVRPPEHFVKHAIMRLGRRPKR